MIQLLLLLEQFVTMISVVRHLWRRNTKRYTTNGAFTTNVNPRTLIEKMTACMAGFIWYVKVNGDVRQDHIQVQ